jgi:hypothetical protein
MPGIAELVCLVAIAHIWARGSLFKRLRECSPPDTFPRTLLNCPLCSGFWIGVGGHVLYLHAPAVVLWLGTGSLVGTLALAACAVIRRL